MAIEPHDKEDSSACQLDDNCAYPFSMLKQDFVLRAIEQLGGALARIVGLQRAQHVDEGLEEVDQAKSRLPVVPGMLDRLTIPSLFKALDDPQLARNVAQLYRLEAELAYASGDKTRAVRALSRSKALLAQAGEAEAQ